MDQGFGLHLMPFSFINVLPHLRLGAQFKSNRFSYLLVVEYGFDNSTDLPNDIAKRDYRFIGLRPEIRYEVSAYNRNLYVGLEFPVTFMERNIDGEFTNDSGTILFVDVAHQNLFRMSVIEKLGFQRLIGQHLYIDAYTGLGVYFRNVEYTDRVGERVASIRHLSRMGLLRSGTKGTTVAARVGIGDTVWVLVLAKIRYFDKAALFSPNHAKTSNLPPPP